MSELVDTVVIGGGQAGLAMSYHLQQIGREHIVLERTRVAENWRSQRWDSLVFQFPSWSIKLPGHTYFDGNPDGFASKAAVAKFIEDYRAAIQAPVRCGVNVHSLRHDSQSKRFVVDTGKGQFKALNAVVATGSYHRPVVPSFSPSMPARLFQVHSRDYRNPHELPPGNVLVVGSGASGAQIAEELHQNGRHVYLSVGRHDKVPRRYRRKDIYWWLDILGIWRRPLDMQPELRTWRPLITGIAGGHDIDFRQFAADGMTLAGRIKGVTGSKLLVASDLEHNLGSADAWFAPFRSRMDAHARKNGLELPADDEPELRAPALPSGLGQIEELDLTEANITSIIWASGFRYDFSWIKLPIFNEKGEPAMRRGVTSCPGLYFLGLRRTYTISSGLLSGVGEDAAYLAERIASRT